MLDLTPLKKSVLLALAFDQATEEVSGSALIVNTGLVHKEYGLPFPRYHINSEAYYNYYFEVKQAWEVISAACVEYGAEWAAALLVKGLEGGLSLRATTEQILDSLLYMATRDGIITQEMLEKVMQF